MASSTLSANVSLSLAATIGGGGVLAVLGEITVWHAEVDPRLHDIWHLSEEGLQIPASH